jgi:hypothetical protein
MNKYFDLSTEQQRMVLTQASVKCKLPVQAVEKDLWVSVVLQIVFSLPFADKLVFKGGTSLSKVWHCINRFSEDIDLVIDPSIWGYGSELTKKQVKGLRKVSSVFVRDEFATALAQGIEKHGLADWLTIIPEPNGEGDSTYPEPRKLHVLYQSLFGNSISYLSSEVLLEIGARSLLEPTSTAEVESLVSQSLPIDTTIVKALIPTAVAEKTFLEKAFLLHEIFSCGIAKGANRKSRHMYDLTMMMDKGVAEKAIADDSLWNTIHHHRATQTSIRGVDYTPDIRDRIMPVPPESMIDDWRSDYKDMSESMIYDVRPSFEELISKMRKIEIMFRERG